MVFHESWEKLTVYVVLQFPLFWDLTACDGGLGHVLLDGRACVCMQGGQEARMHLGDHISAARGSQREERLRNSAFL